MGPDNKFGENHCGGCVKMALKVEYKQIRKKKLTASQAHNVFSPLLLQHCGKGNPKYCLFLIIWKLPYFFLQYPKSIS